MQKLLNALVCTLLVVIATACDNNPVEVNFAQPFPAKRAALAGFAPQDQGQYVAPDDTACTLLVSSQRLIARRFATLNLTAAQLDAIRMPSQLGRKQPYDGQTYLVQPLADGSFHLRWQSLDTLAELGKQPNTQLRRYRGWYYLSAQTDAGTWAVERLAIANGRLHWQEFNGDSLRIKALLPSTVSLVRQKNQLLFTLNPAWGPATRQVNNYQGLWLTKASYLRRAR